MKKGSGQNLVGNTYNQLTVLSFYCTHVKNGNYWLCECN